MQGRHLHNEKYPYDWVSAPRPTPPDASWDHAGDTTHFGRNELKKKDYGRTAQSKSFELLKEYLLKEPIQVYPDTSKPYTLYTDASKYAWAGVLTQRYVDEIEGKEKEIYHPVTYLSGLFRGSQLN